MGCGLIGLKTTNMKITANEINKRLLTFVKGGYDIVLPNFYYGHHECDVFRITQSDLVIEYEIKISRSDFFNDFKKGHEGEKHYNLRYGKGFHCPNRFFFVVPSGLVTKEEVPEYAGLIYFNSGFEIIKSGKLLHKRKFENYRSISHTLAAREQDQRFKLNKVKNFDYEKEISYLKRQVEKERSERIKSNNELYMLKFTKQKTTTQP